MFEALGSYNEEFFFPLSEDGLSLNMFTKDFYVNDVISILVKGIFRVRTVLVR